ncbi:MAG: AbrB/MazE/SpoVT family DNA-binding domain-containing protein [Massiliimalia sp.]
MKATGITRQLDKLGRIVLPKELRRTLNIENEDYLEIFVEDNDRIVLKKYEPTCLFCGSKQNVVEYKDKKICAACLNELSKMGK